MDAFNLVCMGLASPSSSCILLNLSTIYQKVLFRTWYGKWMSQPSLGCSFSGHSSPNHDTDRQNCLRFLLHRQFPRPHTPEDEAGLFQSPKTTAGRCSPRTLLTPTDAWFTRSERACSAYLSHTRSPPAPAWSPQLLGTDGCCPPGLLAHTASRGTPAWSPDEGTGGRAQTSGAGGQRDLPGPCPGRRGTSPQVAGTQC